MLQTLKHTHGLNGVRNGDYKRYWAYCTARLRRFRVATKLTYGKRKFQKKDLDLTAITDERVLTLLLFNAERAWAHAQHLKSAAADHASTVDDEDDIDRSRHHVMTRLAKAAKWANQLAEAGGNCGDSRTQLETRAYAAWMNGNSLLEKGAWAAALTHFKTARTVYDELGKVDTSMEGDVFRARVEELAPSIRYCEYSIQREGGNVADTTALLDDLKLSDLGGDEVLRDRLAAVLAETRKTQAEQLSEVVWRGRRIPIKSEAVRVAIVAMRDAEHEISDAASKKGDSKNKGDKSGLDKLVELYDKLNIAYSDAQQAVSDTIAKTKAPTAQGTAIKDQVTFANLKRLHAFLVFSQKANTVKQYALMAGALQLRLESTSILDVPPAVTADKGATSVGTSKPAKAEDLVRMFDILVAHADALAGAYETALTADEAAFKLTAGGVAANATAVVDSVEAEQADPQRRAALGAGLITWKAFRSYWLGRVYAAQGKHTEAAALLASAADLASEAASQHSGITALSLRDESVVGAVTRLQRDIRAHNSIAHAQSFLMGVEEDGELVGDTTDESDNSRLLDRLESWKAPSVIEHFPPPFAAVPVKPLFFDLARDYIEYPEIESAAGPSAGGATGAQQGGEQKKGWFGIW